MTGLAMPHSPESLPPGWEAWLQQGLELLRQHAAPGEPLPGRQAELQSLVSLWEESRRQGGRAALISGPPGIGKSRLVEELVQRLQVHTLRCRAYDGLRWSPMEPLVGLLYRELGLSRGAPPEDRGQRLLAWLNELSLLQPRNQEPLAWLLGLPGPPCSAARWRGRLAQAGLRVLRALSQREPLLVVVEDVHHADPSTVAFLEWLLERMENCPTLLVLTSEQGGWTKATPVTLAPLAPPESGALARQAHLDETVASHLAEHCLGLPLEVQEAILNAREAPGSGPWPTRLRDTVAARLDRRGPLCAQLAGLAACLEPGFSLEMLLSVAPLWMDPETARAELARLVEAGLLVQRPSGWLHHCHPLVREELYQSLEGATRVQQHQRIAERLRRTPWGDQRPELLALQYGRAGLAHQAAEFWRRAALRAIERGALAEAIGQLRQALAQLSDPESELEFRKLLGVLLQATRGQADPELKANQSRAWELAFSSRPSFAALHGLFLYHLLGSRSEAAGQLQQRMLEVSQDCPEHELEATLAAGLGDFHCGRLNSSRVRLERVLACYREDLHGGHCHVYGHDPRVVALSFRAWLLALQGRCAEALDSARQARERANQLAHPFSQIMAHYFEANATCLMEQPGPTRRAARTAWVQAQREGERYMGSTSAVLGGWARHRLGQTQAGLAQMRLGLTCLRHTGVEISWSFCLSLLSDCCQGEDALELLAEAQAQAHGLQTFMQPLLLTQEGEKRACAKRLEQAAEQSREWGAPWLELRACLAWSRLAARPHPRLSALLESMPQARATPMVAQARELLT